MTDQVENSTPQLSRGRSQWAQLLSNRRAILLLLFGATGVLGLPVLWMSQAFTPGEKMLWSIVNTLYTVMLISVAVGVCYWSYLQIQRAGGF